MAFIYVKQLLFGFCLRDLTKTCKAATLPLCAVTIDFTTTTPRAWFPIWTLLRNPEIVLLSHHELLKISPSKPSYPAHLDHGGELSEAGIHESDGERQKLPHDIKHLESNFKLFPRALKKPLRDFCADEETRDVYVSRQQWYTQTLTVAQDGRSRK
jgi:hypothetical protein